ncbi:hypothetical protein ISCGN_004936 [Ixodes scapularis]
MPYVHGYLDSTRKAENDAFYVLNVYSNPESPRDCVQKLFKEALKIFGHDPIILGGDFNAAHTIGGYRYTTPKGKGIFNTMYREGLTLLTDPITPTRTGTSSCRDTCPDHTFVKNVKDAKWENYNENLGSDHFILKTTAPCTSVMPRKLGQVKIIEWYKWREHRSVSTSIIEDIESWTREAVSSTAAYTKVLTVDEETPCVDPYLLHLWDARRSLTKNQRLKRKLMINIQEISHKAEVYAAELTQQNWYSLCDSIQGRLSSASTLKLLRALLYPDNTRTATSQKDYQGRANPALDEPITIWELEYELTKMKKTAAPGPDFITAKLLYNMDDESTKKLKTYGYIKSFLADRTAILNIGSHTSEPYQLGPRGTPQGAVLSPLLFNLALKGQPQILNSIPGIEYAIYADDITIWCKSGSDAQVEDSLQCAANAVASYARDCGLQCPPPPKKKSELLVFKNPYSRKPPADLNIYIDEQEVTKPKEVRILRQILTQSVRDLSTINKLTASTTHVVGMLRRIRNQRYGLKEKEAIQLVYASVVSRVMYATPYRRLT